MNEADDKLLFMEYDSNVLLKATEYGLINKEIKSDIGFSPTLIINDYKRGLKVFEQLKRELNTCKSFFFSVAFITEGGVTVLLETLKKLEKENIKGQILTSNYLNFSHPKALKKLSEFSNLSVKIYDKNAFHIKGYYFYHGDYSSVLVGSSNLTQSALLSNKEWNIKLSGEENGALIDNVKKEFDLLWTESSILTEEWLKQYEETYYKARELRNKINNIDIRTRNIEPNSMQSIAVNSLIKIREKNESKALLISATGTGKTYLSAFDIKNFNPKKVLFLAHREQLLTQAEESYKTVLGQHIKTGFLSGKHKDYNCDFLFATMTMMAKELSQDSLNIKFKQNEFDYIIIDEAHRSASNSYKKIIDFFKPKFLFGMTATPSRTDAKEVLPIFDRNIALTIDLQQAMEYDLLCPFHYFGISEIKIDGEIINDNTSIKDLSSEERVKNIIEKINFYGYSGDRVKGLVFCSRIDEAKYLSNSFNQRGFNTIALSGEDSVSKRLEAITRLERNNRDKKSLDYIFSVDVFNEGVDIPSVNQIVLLRATKSAVIFIQQLGRGLRKYINKEYVVVLDFIGNYENNYCIPIALSSDKSFNRENIRKTVSDGSSFLPGCSTIEFDEVSKHQIYNAIDNSKLSTKKNIKEEYSFLKSILAHIPSFEEFNKHSNISFNLIIENYGSYYQLIKECEKNNTPYNLNQNELHSLNYLTKKLAMGKDINTLNLFSTIINTPSDKLNENTISYNTSSSEIAIKILSHEYNIIQKTNKNLIKHNACKLITKEDNVIKFTKQFISYLKNPTYVKCASELIVYAKQQHELFFKDKYKNTSLTLFQQYSYEEVCKALNWKKDCSAVIGGYKYDKETNTLPVFINYEKDEEAIKYHDKFESKEFIIASSKKTRPIGTSQDWKNIYHSKENGTKIYLFVRKNKATNNSKDFYFLGEISPVGEALAISTTNNSKKDGFQIRYKIETPVRDDIYNYFTIAE